MAIFWRLALCIAPLAVTPVLALLIAEGYLDFGGGEKDLLLLFPWILWSLSYLIFSVILWIKRKSILISACYAAVGSMGLMILLWVGLYVFSVTQLGMK